MDSRAFDSRHDFEFKPFPNEVFAHDANITCVGVEVADHRGNKIGKIESYRIEGGDLILKVVQD